MPVISTTWEIQFGELQFEASWDKNSKTLSQKQALHGISHL
jgi:hypothetical protein